MMFISRGSQALDKHAWPRPLIQQLGQGKMGKDFYPSCQGTSKELDGTEGGGGEKMHIESEEAWWGWQNLTLAGLPGDVGASFLA